MTSTKQFTIATHYVSALSARVTALNRRAERLGVPLIEMTIGEPRMELTTQTKVERAVEVCDVVLSLNVPHLAGWEFIVAIQHGDGVNILAGPARPEGAPAVDLTPYRTCRPNCEHCNQPRLRRDTYVVRHEDGRLVQVGKDCLAHFTGYGKTPEEAAQVAEFLTKFGLLLDGPTRKPDDGDEGEGSAGFRGYGLMTFLSYVAACARVHGFRTRKQAEETYTSSTKDDAIMHLDPPRGLKNRITPEDCDKELAQAARAWALALEGESDFDHNLRAAASADAVEYRHLGIAAYIVGGYLRSLAKKAEKVERPASAHFGEVKARLRKLALTYLGSASFDSAFGTTFIHRFQTAEGNDAIWKTGTNLGEVKPGDVLTVDATVKEHGEFRGRPQTVLTRLAILEGQK